MNYFPYQACFQDLTNLVKKEKTPISQERFTPNPYITSTHSGIDSFKQH